MRNQPKTMRLLVTLVLVVLINGSSGHWIVPVVGNGHLVAPHGYVVYHQLPDFVQQEGAQHDVSRETLEEQSGDEGFLQQIPDISVEQAHLNPNAPPHQPQPPPPPTSGESGEETWDNGGSQIPQKPQIPDDSQQHVPPVGPAKGPPSTSSAQGGEEEEHHGGMPYSYNYDAVLSSKTETADDQGNVEGSYTYIDGAGIKRTVTYTVKGNEGFVAKGDIYPDPGSPDTNSRPGVDTPPSGGQNPIRPKITPPVESQKPILPPVPPPTKGGRPRPPPPPPPTKGGRPRPPTAPPVKGGASGWDKYPLGR